MHSYTEDTQLDREANQLIWKMKKYKRDPHERTTFLQDQIEDQTGVVPFSLTNSTNLEFGTSTVHQPKDLQTLAMASIRLNGQPLDNYTPKSTYSLPEQRDLLALENYQAYLLRTAKLCADLQSKLEIIVLKKTLEYQDLTHMELLVMIFVNVTKSLMSVIT